MIILEVSDHEKSNPPKWSKLWLFRLISVLYDEYMFFPVEHKVALETGENGENQ
jgi:hypothetical protein